jgi:hypothetical protein
VRRAHQIAQIHGLADACRGNPEIPSHRVRSLTVNHDHAPNEVSLSQSERVGRELSGRGRVAPAARAAFGDRRVARAPPGTREPPTTRLHSSRGHSDDLPQPSTPELLARRSR